MDGSTLCSLTADLRDEAEDDAGQSPGPQGGLRDRLGTKAPKPPAATSRENAPSELIFSSPARPSSFLQSLSSPPLPILAMSSALRAAVQQVCQQPHTPPTTPLTPLPSPQSRRSAFARSARYASTSAKAPTLKERLAELIPAEIENVCAPFFVSPRSPTAHPSISLAIGESHPCCTRQKVLRSRSR